MVRIKRESLFTRITSKLLTTKIDVPGRVFKAARHGLSADEVERLTGFHPEPETPGTTYTVEFYEEV